MKEILCIGLLLMLLSCEQSDCITCRSEIDSLDICDEEGITRTDINGNPMTKEEFAQSLEQIGFECN